MHIHWYKVINDTGSIRYVKCRCGQRQAHRIKGSDPIDYYWVETGLWTEMEPTITTGLAPMKTWVENDKALRREIKELRNTIKSLQHTIRIWGLNNQKDE